MSRSEIDYLRHILDEARYLSDKSGEVTWEKFKDDDTLQRAFVRSIEIMGEASKKLSDQFRNQHDNVNWRDMAGMRDRLIHGYFGVDYELVWDVAKNKAPKLVDEISRIIVIENKN